MSDHQDESLIDKVKNAFGMGSDDVHSHDDHAHGDHGHGDHGHGDHGHDQAAEERPEGWAGVDDALGGTENRPTGPDYAAQDLPAGIGDDSGSLETAPLGGGTTGAYPDSGEEADRDAGFGTTDGSPGEPSSDQPLSESDPNRRDPGL